MFNTMPSTQYIANGSHFVKVDKESNVEMLKNPVPLGPELVRGEHYPKSQEFEKARTQMNVDRIHRDRNNY